jgi:alpha/beta superfamily hydrolase
LEPVFFGDPALFGVYHPALAEAERPLGVLLCPPIGHEHTRSYRALKGLAEALARAGHHVLRFGYRGLGDSGGEFAESTPDRWCDDIACAVEELAALSGMKELWFVGLRLGAALALRAEAASRRGRGRLRVRALVLWDPVLCGRDFLETADQLHSTFVRDVTRFPRLSRIAGGASPAAGDERLGYPYPASLRESLLALDLRDGRDWPAVPARLVLTETNPALDSLVCQLESEGRSAACVRVANADGDWSDYERHETTLRAGRAIRAIVELVGNGKP